MGAKTPLHILVCGERADLLLGVDDAFHHLREVEHVKDDCGRDACLPADSKYACYVGGMPNLSLRQPNYTPFTASTHVW